MKIAVVGEMNPRQQLVIDKMIADGHEIVYIGKDDPYGGMDMNFCIVDECSDVWNSMFDGTQFPTIGLVQYLNGKLKHGHRSLIIVRRRNTNNDQLPTKIRTQQRL